MSSSKNYLLTIDVGTVNLAYCLSEYSSDSVDKKILDNLNIIDWGILDVSYKPLYCKQIKNKRAICNCISKFYCLKDGCTDHSNPENLIGYCKTHAKPIQQHNKVNKKNKIKIYKISENPIYKNNFNIQMERLLSNLEKFYLDVIETPYDIDSSGNPKYISNLKIYIENQPVFKNPVMKTISIGIFTFFTLKKVLNSSIISSVNFINATVKTKDDFISKLFEIVEVKSYIDKFKDYDKRKEFTIDITNQICPKLKNTVNNIVSTSNYILAKKKDDMADTLVYVIYVIIYLINQSN
jgi:hypothetical protein